VADPVAAAVLAAAALVVVVDVVLTVRAGVVLRATRRN
jgi:hypothetical protein